MESLRAAQGVLTHLEGNEKLLNGFKPCSNAHFRKITVDKRAENRLEGMRLGAHCYGSGEGGRGLSRVTAPG